jgi:hypothetical protein
MRVGISLAVISCALLISTCASGPGLGFPAASAGIPVRVTLCSTIAKQGVIDYDLDIPSEELWKLLYGEKYEKMLAGIRLDELQTLLDLAFLERASESTKVFIPDPHQVFHGDVPPAAPADDSADHSQLQPDGHGDIVSPQYILALSIDQWGFVVSRDKQKEGPYLTIVLRLVEKDTGKNIWAFSKTYVEQITEELSDVNYGSITSEEIEKVYKLIIPKAIDRIFSQLGG